MGKFFNKNDFLLLGKALVYIKPYKIRFLLTFLCIISSILFGLIQPLLWGKIVTGLFSKDLKNIIPLVLYLVLLYVSQSAIGFFQSYLFSSLSENIVYNIKGDMYKKIFDLPIKAFDEIRDGEFISRMHGDAMVVANIITSQLINTIVDILRVIIIGFAVFKINVSLGFIVLLSFPFSFLIYFIFGKRLRYKKEELAKLNDSYFSFIEQSIFGIKEIKSLGIRNYKINEFKDLSSSIKNKNISIGVLNNISQTLSGVVNFASQIIVILVGGYFIYKEVLTIDYFIAFSSYSIQFTGSLMNITSINSSIQQAFTSLYRIFGLMDNLNYSEEKFGKLNMKEISGRIKFNNVCFKYEADRDVLNDISFEAMENKRFAIIGESGCGKTTIFNLLVRFYEPFKGKITIDGINISDFDEESLRKHISVVHQDPILFKGSIKENMLIANPNATDDSIFKACKLAHIHEFIMGLKGGYDSIIGENAVNLSNGQKQRIAIARALLRNSKIILFDEATSSLDNESQYNIKKAINEISKEHTVIIIAHRLLTIIDADEIIILKEGRIVGKGKHGILIDENDIYKRLYKAEFDIISRNYVEVI